jgi:hypothetical protein
MITQTRNLSIATVLIVAIVHQAGAQTSRVEVSGGYAITHAADQLLPFGWSADIATNLNRTWSMVGEVSGAYKVIEDEDLGVDVNLSLYSLGAGARWSSRVAPRIVPFVQVLAGAARVSAKAEMLGRKIGDALTNFMLQPGGGVNVKMNEAFGLFGQMDYRRVFLDEQEDRESGNNHFRVIVGVRFGL